MDHNYFINKCNICQFDCDDPVDYGDFLQKFNMKLHYYCLLLSTDLPQKGKDKSGFNGFLVRDIKENIEKYKKIICHYCELKNASIKCSSCSIYFHLKCGLENNCLFQFGGKYKSFCHMHHNVKHTIEHSLSDGCYICRDFMGEYNSLTSITSVCCETNGWVHRRCLKYYALTSGYLLKCLWCSNPSFREYARYNGIYVPDRDALWERGRAYSELHNPVREKICTSSNCICPKGKNFNSKKWKLIYCFTCGTFPIHNLCFLENGGANRFICELCLHIIKPQTELNQSTALTKYESLIKSQPFSNLYSKDNTVQKCHSFLTISQCYSFLNSVCRDLSFLSGSLDFENKNKQDNNALNNDKEKSDDIDKTINDDNLKIKIFHEKNNIVGICEYNEDEVNNSFEYFKNENRLILVSQNDELLINLVKEQLDEKKNTTINLSDSDSEAESGISLIEKWTNEVEINVPKPLMKNKEIEEQNSVRRRIKLLLKNFENKLPTIS